MADTRRWGACDRSDERLGWGHGDPYVFPAGVAEHEHVLDRSPEHRSERLGHQIPECDHDLEQERCCAPSGQPDEQATQRHDQEVDSEVDHPSGAGERGAPGTPGPTLGP